MREFRPNNLEPLVNIFILFLLLLEQFFWKICNPSSSIIAMVSVLAFNIYAIVKAKKEWNSIYLIDSEKIIYICNGGKEKQTIYWASVVEAKAFGWKYFPFMFKNFTIDDGNSIIPIRMVGFSQYKEVWLFAYDRICELSPSVITNNNLDKAIQRIRTKTEKTDKTDNGKTEKTGDGSVSSDDSNN